MRHTNWRTPPSNLHDAPETAPSVTNRQIINTRFRHVRAGDWLVNYLPSESRGPHHKGARSLFAGRKPVYCNDHGHDCMVIDMGSYKLYGRGSEVVQVARGAA